MARDHQGVNIRELAMMIAVLIGGRIRGVKSAIRKT